jgi:hypothetical protein
MEQINKKYYRIYNCCMMELKYTFELNSFLIYAVNYINNYESDDENDS